jgi:hypothetical protein
MQSPIDHINAIITAAMPIPKGLQDMGRHSPEWRRLLEHLISSASRYPSVSRMDMRIAQLYQDHLAVPAGEGVRDTESNLPLNVRNAKLAVDIRINEAASELGLYANHKIGDIVELGEDFTNCGAMTARSGDAGRVVLPPIYDAKGLLWLGEWA